MYALFHLVLVGIGLLALPLQNTTDYGLRQQKLLPVLELEAQEKGVSRLAGLASPKTSLLGLQRATFSLGFPGSSAGKESAYDLGDLGSIPGLGRCPGEGKGTYSRILAWRIPWTV